VFRFGNKIPETPVGIRNMLIHAYFVVSLPIVWDVVTSKLSSLADACRELLAEE